MKKHVSVIALLVRNKLAKALMSYLIMIVFSIVAYVLFHLNKSFFFGGGQVPVLYWGFVIGYLCCVLSMIEAPTKKSRVKFFYQRLQISERAVFLWEVLVNVLFFLILWGIEICLLVFLIKNSMSTSAFMHGNQEMSIIFLKSKYFHGLVPLSETGLWNRNLLYMICCGILTAGLNVMMRNILDSNNMIMACLFLFLFGILIDLPSRLGLCSYVMAFFILLFTMASGIWTIVTTHDGTLAKPVK